MAWPQAIILETLMNNKKLRTSFPHFSYLSVLILSLVFLLLILRIGNILGFTLNTSNNAAFDLTDRELPFYVANVTCQNNGATPKELLELATEAADQFWNKVSTSELRLVPGGLTEVNAIFHSSPLCVDYVISYCEANSDLKLNLPIVIGCNNDDQTTNANFTSGSVIAVTLPNQIASSEISGSIILINDTGDSPWSGLTRQEKVSALAHEMGHAVGLGHSNNIDSLMYYQNITNRVRLGQDDMDGISYLYPSREKFFGLVGCGTISDESKRELNRQLGISEKGPRSTHKDNGNNHRHHLHQHNHLEEVIAAKNKGHWLLFGLACISFVISYCLIQLFVSNRSSKK